MVNLATSKPYQDLPDKNVYKNCLIGFPFIHLANNNDTNLEPTHVIRHDFIYFRRYLRHSYSWVKMKRKCSNFIPRFGSEDFISLR